MANVLIFDILAKDRASGAFKKIGREADQSRRHVDRTGKSFTGLSSRLGLFSRVGPRALTLFSTGLAAVGIGAAVMGTKTAAGLEQANIAFTALLGSGKKAQVFLGDLKKFAAATPFELPGLISVSRQLVGAGEAAKDVIPTLKAWGDASGALGLNQEQFSRTMLAVTQAMNKGKLQGEELMQITEAGIPIWPILSKALHKPIPELQKLSSQGKLLAKDVFPALERQMEKDYGGSMAKQSKTLAGLWSTLMDTINIGLADTLQPLLPFMKTALAGAIKGLGSAFALLPKAVKAVQPYITSFGESLQSDGVSGISRLAVSIRDNAVPVLQSLGKWVTDSLIPSLKNLWITFGPLVISTGQFAVQAARLAVELGTKLLGAIKPVTKWMADHKTLIQATAVVLGTLIVGWKLYQGAIKLVVAVTRTYAAVQAGLNVVLAANPIGLIVIALAALTAGLIYAYKHSETFRRIVDGAFRAVRDSAVAVFTWIKRNWPLLVGILTGPFGVVTVLIVKNWGKIKHAFRNGVADIVDVFLAGVGMIIHGAANAFGWVPKLGPKLKDAAKKFDKFRDDVNRSLRGIRDQNVVIRGKFVAPAGVNVVIKSGRAAGGIIPGAPSNRDNRLMPMASGEYVVNARQTQKYLPLLEAINSGIGFASGGLVPHAATAGALRGVRRFAGRANSFFGRFADALSAAFSSLLLGAGPGGGAGVSRWANVILQALGLLGQPSSLLNAVLSRMRRESGGNPTIVNKWDSNWRRGTPSVGLMQVIGPTFSSYAGRFRDVGPFLYGVSTNPLANIFAGLNYAQHRYPTLEYAMLKPGGYDRGGWLMPGATLAMNTTGRPERVLPPGDGRMRLHPADIQALGEVMGRVVLSGLGAANTRSARTADLYARTA